MSEENDEVLDLKELEKEIEQLSNENHIRSMLQTQLSEYEMLVSMFSNPGELTMKDHSIISDFHNYLDGKTELIPPQMSYTIHLNVGVQKLEISVDIPLEYPFLEPDIFVRSQALSNSQQRALNRDISNYISGLDREEICICSAVGWLQENALEYFSKETDEKPEKVENHQVEDSFSRYWIYSHHIYSKIKRKEILDLAQNYKLTGFCLPGRPGFICFEGYTENCKEYWQKLKSMTWKKIQCKKVKEIKSENLEMARKFSVFEEISFEGGKMKKRDFHMDLGDFYKFLTDHQCSYIFKEYFGIDGK